MTNVARSTSIKYEWLSWVWRRLTKDERKAGVADFVDRVGLHHAQVERIQRYVGKLHSFGWERVLAP